jgi:hypothetical protein
MFDDADHAAGLFYPQLMKEIQTGKSADDLMRDGRAFTVSSVRAIEGKSTHVKPARRAGTAVSPLHDCRSDR